MCTARLRTLFVVTLSLASAPAVADVNTRETEEQQQLESGNPKAAALVKDADKALASGDARRAAGILEKAREAAPQNALPVRRHCEALIALGDKAKAIATCRQASQIGGSPLELRMSVAAHVRGPVPPTSEELAFASLMAEEVKRRVPTSVFGAAAWCDIARRLGDQRMMRDCLEEMQRLGPEHPETKKMMALLGPQKPWTRYFGWGLLGAVIVATAAHAFMRRARQRLAHVSAGAALVLTLAAAGQASANELPVQVQIDVQNPEKSIPSADEIAKNPLQFGYLLQDLIERAAEATKRGDHQAAVRYYRALAKAVPDRATSFSKLCAAYEALNDRASALDACATALTREGVTADDYVRFVRMVLAQAGPLPEKERAAALSAVEHLRAQPAAAVVGNHLACELALRLDDRALLEACTTGLAALAPKDPKTVSFQWALAMHKGDAGEARRLVRRAEELGLPAEALKHMREATDARLGGIRPWTMALGLLAMALLGGVFVLRARRHPRPQRA